jgi:hypothetical protein
VFQICEDDGKIRLGVEKLTFHPHLKLKSITIFTYLESLRKTEQEWPFNAHLFLTKIAFLVYRQFYRIAAVSRVECHHTQPRQKLLQLVSVASLNDIFMNLTNLNCQNYSVFRKDSKYVKIVMLFSFRCG